MNKYIINKNMCKMQYQYLYQYIDVINPEKYLNMIETNAEKDNEWSFRVLLNDLEKGVCFYENNNYLEFKNKILQILKNMDKHLKMGDIKILEKKNKECLDLFYKFINIEKDVLVKTFDIGFYISLKKELFNKLILIKKFFNKLSDEKTIEKQKYFLNRFIKKMMTDFNVRINNLKYYYKTNKELTKYDDLILINLNNTTEIDHVLESIKYNSRRYEKHILPDKDIIEKTVNIKTYSFLYCTNKLIVLTNLTTICFLTCEKNLLNNFRNENTKYFLCNKYENSFQNITFELKIKKHYYFNYIYITINIEMDGIFITSQLNPPLNYILDLKLHDFYEIYICLFMFLIYIENININIKFIYSKCKNSINNKIQNYFKIYIVKLYVWCLIILLENFFCVNINRLFTFINYKTRKKHKFVSLLF